MEENEQTEAIPPATEPDRKNEPSLEPLPDAPEAMRIDVWLWAVRQLKSRSAATSACRAGHVKLNGESAKASTKVRVGDEVRLRVHGFDRVLKVKHLLVKRMGAPIAQRCYRDETPQRLTQWQFIPVAKRAPGTGRPTKKERRQLDAFRGRDSR